MAKAVPIVEPSPFVVFNCLVGGEAKWNPSRVRLMGARHADNSSPPSMNGISMLFKDSFMHDLGEWDAEALNQRNTNIVGCSVAVTFITELKVGVLGLSRWMSTSNTGFKISKHDLCFVWVCLQVSEIENGTAAMIVEHGPVIKYNETLEVHDVKILW